MIESKIKERRKKPSYSNSIWYQNEGNLRFKQEKHEINSQMNQSTSPKKENIEKMFHEEGWGHLRAGETLCNLEHEKVLPDYPLHQIRKSDTKNDVFR